MMYATLTYIQTRQPYADIPGQPPLGPPPGGLPTPDINSNDASVPGEAGPQLTNGDDISVPQQPQQAEQVQPNGTTVAAKPAEDQSAPDGRPRTPPPERPEVFNRAMREMARGLVLQEQQIEYIINSLPGLGDSEASQVSRMRELEVELRAVEVERARAEGEREALVGLLGGLLVQGVRRVP